MLLTLWEKLLRDVKRVGGVLPADAAPAPAVVAALSDDLNTPLALKALRDLASEVRLGGTRGVEAYGAFVASLDLMGISPDGFRSAAIQRSLEQAFAGEGRAEFDRRVRGLLDARDEARAARDFRRADAIRAGLTAAGIKVMDRNGGASEWELGPDFDPVKLDAIES